jgi:hypothetical protein
MNELRGPEPAHPGNVQTFGDGHETDDATAIPRRRSARWGRIAAVSLVAAIAVWAIGREAAQRIERQDIEVSSRRQEPAPGFPASRKVADNNNAIMRKGLVGDLDGTAIAYASEVDGLVANDGRFQTGLTLEPMARILNVGVATISRPDAPHEIDPAAVLFKVQAGQLTEPARELSRKRRNEQALQGRKRDAVYGDWIVKELSFTLNRLNHPNEEERTVLEAISRSARAMMPQPGDKLRAVSVARGDLESGSVILTTGMLPLEAQQDTAATIGTE